MANDVQCLHQNKWMATRLVQRRARQEVLAKAREARRTSKNAVLLLYALLWGRLESRTTAGCVDAIFDASDGRRTHCGLECDGTKGKRY